MVRQQHTNSREETGIQRGIIVLTERTYFDKYQEKFAEKVIEKLADNAVEIAFGPNRTQLSVQRSKQQSFSVQGFSFSKEMIFGIGGYIVVTVLR
jgi:hypothetical protein